MGTRWNWGCLGLIGFVVTFWLGLACGVWILNK